MAMDSGNYAPTGASYGEFTIMQMSGTPTAKASSFQKEDFVAKYALSNRTLTARELAMVPTLPDWYIIPKEVVRVCEHAKVTTASSQPMRNFLFRGEAGTGKTMGAQAIAAGLNLPYTLMTCSANTEITDLVGQFIPDTGNFQSGSNCTELPKISDITMHLPSVYMMLTGEYDEEKTEDDVLQKLIEIAVGNLVEKEETPGQRIRYVDTPLVEAIRHGYVCELQEPSCIANPGVLVGLNSLLDNCQVITLPTGERVKRHPDTVIVVTTNSDYSGCRDMNQSVISRMDLIYDMEAPDLNTMVKRVMNVTGFTDEQEATKMAIVVRDVAERCRQTMITDGSCGMREFKSWVLSTMVTHDPYESALSTIISSASADPDTEAFLDMKQEAWITAHVHAYNYFGGVTRILTPDNLKTGVIKNTRTETVLNKAYQEMAEHYGTAIIPTRPRTPKDKAFVEGSVGVVSTWILAALRNRQFLSLDELNRAIWEKLADFNHKPFQKKDGSRASDFEEEKLFPLPLPPNPFELAEWKTATVQYNYHISVDRMNYSDPYEYIKQKVDVRLTGSAVEIYFCGTRVASHLRLYGRPNQYSMLEEHMPPEHTAYLQWNSKRFLRWASSIGENTAAVVRVFLTAHKVEQQGYKSCMALLKLSDHYSVVRLEDACRKALTFTPSHSLKSVQAILKSEQDLLQTEDVDPEPVPQKAHRFTRGAEYYRRGKK